MSESLSKIAYDSDRGLISFEPLCTAASNRLLPVTPHSCGSDIVHEAFNISVGAVHSFVAATELASDSIL